MDPQLDGALAGAVVGAVLGVLGTYVFDLRRANQDRRDRMERESSERSRNRAAVATVLLQDLRSIEFDLSQVYDAEQPSRMALFPPFLYHEALRQEMRWFEPSSILPIAEFFRRANHVYSAYRELRSIEKGTITSTPRREYELRTHAAFALRLAPDAASALEREGGIRAESKTWEPVTQPVLPAIPPPVFAETRARRAALSSRDSGGV